MSSERRLESKTGGRQATTSVIPGDCALAVGCPSTELPDGWRWTLLSSVARLETGHTPSRKHPEYWGGDIPWIGIRDATSNHGRTIFQTAQYTNELGIRNSSARILPRHTVCLSRTASVGYVIVMGVPMSTSQDFVNWVCGPEIDHRYLKYVLIAEHRAFIRFASGTTHQTVYFPEVKAFHVAMPLLKEQMRIADVLGVLDDRIDNLRATNATLEAIAQAIFKSWFIDFDPVRAKTEGREPEGMDAETAALFPSKFEESELGLIPSGWRVQPIGELTEIVGGSTPDTKNEDYWAPGVFHWTSPKDLSGATAPVLIDTERSVSEAGLTKISSGLLPPETLLLSSRAPIGYLSLSKIPVAINQGYIAMLPGGTLPTVYLYFWTQANMEVIKDRSNGSTFMEISKKMFRPINALVPPQAVVGRFAGVAESFFDRITANERQAHHLSDLRDLLLPRLISGKISIGAAEAALEAA